MNFLRVFSTSFLQKSSQVLPSFLSGTQSKFFGSSIFQNGFPSTVLGGIREMKYGSSVKKICAKCKLVRRKRILTIICENPKHKQKQRACFKKSK